ncbi:DUF4186 domain-containing protein [bacterium]|nr:DUF4186 domain-containing protein [bacterium]
MFKSVEECFNALSKSKFRSSFHLKGKDLLYAKTHDIETLEAHVLEIINKRLDLNNGFVDGKQTPYRGHPAFVAQHATATCCRGCIKKWHGIEENRKLTTEEKEYLKNIIISWIKKEI